jgi:hypothetical protein
MAAALEFLKQPTEDPADGGRLAGASSVSDQEARMAEERDKFANDPDQGEDVEGHKFSPDDDKFEKFADSSEDDDVDEVEAHKF